MQEQDESTGGRWIYRRRGAEPRCVAWLRAGSEQVGPEPRLGPVPLELQHAAVVHICRGGEGRGERVGWSCGWLDPL